MIRILPTTILFMLAFVGFIGFKSYSDSAQDKETDKIVSQLNQDLSQLEPASGGEKPAAEKKEEGAKAEELPSYVKKERPAEDIPALTASGKELLQQMSARRTELDQWKKDLDLRASLIEASSKKLDDKIAKLEELKTVTQNLLDEYKGEDSKKIKGMVKVYENMKPKEAAKVFDQLEMPILLELVGQMNERRISPILAKMNAAKAKELTEKILENRDIAKM